MASVYITVSHLGNFSICRIQLLDFPASMDRSGWREITFDLILARLSGYGCYRPPDLGIFLFWIMDGVIVPLSRLAHNLGSSWIHSSYSKSKWQLWPISPLHSFIMCTSCIPSWNWRFSGAIHSIGYHLQSQTWLGPVYLSDGLP